MAANSLSIAKHIAALTIKERETLLAIADMLKGQRKYTRKRKPRVAKIAAPAAPVVARKAADPNRPKRKYTKKSAFWKGRGKGAK